MADPKSPYAEHMNTGNLQWLPRFRPQAPSEPEVAVYDAPEVADNPPEEPAWLIVAPKQPPSRGTGSTHDDDAKSESSWQDALPAGTAANTGSTSLADNCPITRNRPWLRRAIIAGVLAALMTGTIAGAIIGTRNRGGGDENQGAQVGSGSGHSNNTSDPDPGEGSSGSPPVVIPQNTTLEVATRTEAVPVNTNFTATFTQHAGVCTMPRNACGFTADPGYLAAVSQNLFGVGPLVLGSGDPAPPGPRPGPECETCWRLHATKNKDGGQMDKSIVVKVNNICAAQTNPTCAQKNLQDVNSNGTQVTFSLCSGSGAVEALFLPGSEFAIGNATKVDCSAWTGTVRSAPKFGPGFGRPTAAPAPQKTQG